MESFDSRVAHSSEASTDERASPPPPAMPSPAAVPAQPLPADRFAARPEEEARFAGARGGAETAKSGGACPLRHVPPGFDLELTRGSEESALVSGKLADAGAAPAGRKLRHDGWTPEKERIFLTTLAATGVVADACRACAMSRDAAYSRRNATAGRAFALGWKAALVLAHPAMVDDVMSRARHGVIERIYRDGEVVAERHRHDNRLAMAVLTRLDRQVEGLAEREPAVQAVANEFEQFLDLLAGGSEAAEAFLTPRLTSDTFEPPHFRNAGHSKDSEPALLARAAFRERHGVGMPSDVDIEDLDVSGMASWTDDQLRRAEASGLLQSLDDDRWPPAALDGEADGTDGMCKLRKLYLRINPPEAQDWEEE